MQNPQECDVLVIGGGPAGSTTAALLAEAGRNVVLLEKDRLPQFHIGKSLLPLNLPLFEFLGMGEASRIFDISVSGSRQMTMKTAFVTVFSLVFAALAPHASAGLSDIEITASYCLGVITAQIPNADSITASTQSSIAAQQQYIRFWEGQIATYERAIAPIEQVARARPLSESEKQAYDNLKESAKRDRAFLEQQRAFLESERESLSKPSELRTNKNRLYSYLVAKGLLFDPSRSIDVIPLMGMTERGKADMAECASVGLSCMKRSCGNNLATNSCTSQSGARISFADVISSCSKGAACQRMDRCSNLNWLPL